jgi:hypothetical protein
MRIRQLIAFVVVSGASVATALGLIGPGVLHTAPAHLADGTCYEISNGALTPGAPITVCL